MKRFRFHFLDSFKTFKKRNDCDYSDDDDDDDDDCAKHMLCSRPPRIAKSACQFLISAHLFVVADIRPQKAFGCVWGTISAASIATYKGLKKSATLAPRVIDGQQATNHESNIHVG